MDCSQNDSFLVCIMLKKMLVLGLIVFNHFFIIWLLVNGTFINKQLKHFLDSQVVVQYESTHACTTTRRFV